jgi:hypothetical protein
VEFGRRRSVSLLLTSMLALAVVGGPATSAQDDPVAVAFCASLTVEEIAAAIGAQVAAEPGFEGCNWASDGTDGTFAYLSASWDSQTTIESVAELWPGGTTLTVADRPAYFVSDYGMLWVLLDQGVLFLSLGAATDVDKQAALESVAALIVSRAGTLVAPPPPATQAPAAHEDPELEALFPKTVGGQPLTLQSMSGSEVFSSDTDGAEEILAQLSADGKTMDDLSFASGATADFSAFIYAIRIAGGDATKYLPILLASTEADAQQAPGQVAGKNVTVLTTSSGAQHVYPRNDVIWVVTAQEPALSEIFTALP